MRNEDEAFADIVKQEFDEKWTPAPSPEPAKAPEPQDDFHLNLYDDDESYREIPTRWSLSFMTLMGIGFIASGIVIAVVKAFLPRLPGWMGWTGVGCFVIGVAMILWHATHTRSEQDEEGSSPG